MPSPFVLFCSNPLDPRSVEPDFAVEAKVVRQLGFTPVLLDHDELDHRIDPASALRKTRFDSEGVAIYRGWMLRVDAYASLYDALSARGIRLLTSPAEYAACHHAPASYPALAKWMPLTKWLPLSEIDDRTAIEATLSKFGTAPIIIKDWVKSQASGYWKEACYIPDASNIFEAARLIARFRELQGESLTGGLVFKAYVPLLPHGAPAHEYRSFVVGGRAVGCWPRSDAAKAYSPPPDALLQAVAASAPSPFASADFGLDTDGKWWLLEVGDGQVSGLPNSNVAPMLFETLTAFAAQ